MASLEGSSNIIEEIGTTPDKMTGRGGLSVFVRYLRNIGRSPDPGRLAGSIRKTKKGLRVPELFKQVFCFFVKHELWIEHS